MPYGERRSSLMIFPLKGEVEVSRYPALIILPRLWPYTPLCSLSDRRRWINQTIPFNFSGLTARFKTDLKMSGYVYAWKVIRSRFLISRSEPLFRLNSYRINKRFTYSCDTSCEVSCFISLRFHPTLKAHSRSICILEATSVRITNLKIIFSFKEGKR